MGYDTHPSVQDLVDWALAPKLEGHGLPALVVQIANPAQPTWYRVRLQKAVRVLIKQVCRKHRRRVVAQRQLAALGVLRDDATRLEHYAPPVETYKTVGHTGHWTGD